MEAFADDQSSLVLLVRREPLAGLDRDASLRTRAQVP
jgi:hypothetical protein